MAIRGLVFDAYGTLYDVQSIRTVAVELCGEKGELVTQLWRLKQLEYTWLRGLMLHYEDFWSVTRASLEFTLETLAVAVRALDAKVPQSRPLSRGTRSIELAQGPQARHPIEW